MQTPLQLQSRLLIRLEMEGASAGSQNSSYCTRSCRGFRTTLGYLISHGPAIISTSLAEQALEGELHLEMIWLSLMTVKIDCAYGRPTSNEHKGSVGNNTILLLARSSRKRNKKYSHQDGSFNASTLEVEMKRVVASRSNGDETLRMLDEEETFSTGRAYDFLILK